MGLTILYPCDYFDHGQAEEEYLPEYRQARKREEYRACLFDYDAFLEGEPLKLNPFPQWGGLCVYRGWMLGPGQYGQLYRALRQQGLVLINTPEQYAACHLFPNVYAQLEGDTPGAVWFPQGEVVDWNRINRLFGRFMIKDYVKSVKGSGFPQSFETPVNGDEMEPLLEQFRELRGNLFTGGFLFKEFVSLRQYGEATNEYRVFYLDGVPITLSRNTGQPVSCPEPPRTFVERFTALPSRFYTVDFAELSDGRWVVVETGDGQVSGLSPGQDVEAFYGKVAKATR